MRSFFTIIVMTVFWGAAVIIGSAVAEDIVYSENFDSGMGAWSGQWGIATVHYHSAPNSMADSPVGPIRPSEIIPRIPQSRFN